MAVTLTPGPTAARDAVLLCLLGLLCVRSYETMVYLGPLVAAAIVWSMRKDDDPWVRGLAAVAALAFVAAGVVALVAIVDYWNHPHFLKVRAMTFDFWQNLQFVVPLVGLAISAAVALLRPSWLQGSGPPLVIGIAAIALALSPWYRLVYEHSILYPPAHYLARQAAGVAAGGAARLHVAARRLAATAARGLHHPAPARSVAAPGAGHDGAGARRRRARRGADRPVVDYLARMRTLVDTREGVIRASDLPLLEWPDKLFAQDWSCRR